MKNRDAGAQRTKRSILLIVCLTTIVGALASGPLQAARLNNVTPPPVPTTLQVPPQNEPFFVGYAVGTQNYVCLPSGSDLVWTLFTPQATLFNDNIRQAVTHFFSPNPFENGIVRATWEDSRDTSTVWGQVTASSSDAKFVTPGSIPWLLVQVVGAHAGPTGGSRLKATTFIQRLNTVGGQAPATGCSQLTDIGSKIFVPYRADYYFYQERTRRY